MVKMSAMLVWVAFFISFFLHGYADGHTAVASELRKAEVLIANGEYSKARLLLSSLDSEKTPPAKIQYLIGVCFIRNRQYKEAKSRFRDAASLDPDCRPEIGREYLKAGAVSLQKGVSGVASVLFKRALEYASDLKPEIGEEYFNTGRSYLEQHESRKADRMFTLALSHAPHLKKKIDDTTSAYAKGVLSSSKGKEVMR